VNWICNRLWHWLGGYGPPSLQSVLYAKWFASLWTL